MTTCKRKTLLKWQKDIRLYAESKGFIWRREQIDTILLRIHGELSEAFVAYVDDGCIFSVHFAEELADVAIRIFDCAEVMGLNLEVLTKCKFIGDASVIVEGDSVCETVFMFLLGIHTHLSDAGESLRKCDNQFFGLSVGRALLNLFGLAETFGINLEDEVNKKHAVNLKRPFMHGKPKMRSVKNVCPKHKRYTGKLKPRVKCLECDEIYKITHETFKEGV